MFMPTVWNIVDGVDASGKFINRIFKRKSKGEQESYSSKDEAVKAARANFDNIVNGSDIHDLLLARKLVGVKESEAEELVRLGADYNAEKNEWFVPMTIKNLDPFKKWWPEIPIDLRHREPRMIQTKMGKSIEGYVLPEDRIKGGDSLATPLLYAAFPALSALTYVLLNIHLVMGALSSLLIIPFLVALCQGEGVKEGVWSLIKYYLGPMLLAAVIGTLSGVGSVMGGLVMMIPVAGPSLAGMASGGLTTVTMTAFALIIPIAIIVFLSMMVSELVVGEDKETGVVIGGFGQRVKHAIKWAAIWAAIIAISGLLPDGMMAAAAYIAACFAPMTYSERDFIARAQDLEEQGTAYNLAAANEGPLGITNTVRQEQLKAAIKDTSPIIILGIASGNQAKRQYAYGPDRGAPMVLSCNDFSMHFLGFGDTGKGKTTNMARPIALQYRAGMFGGALIRDGKGTLAGELRQIIDLMIEPGIPLALLEGLDAEGVAIALNSFGNKAAKDPTWEQQADQFIEHATTIHEALVKHEPFYKELAIRQARSLENQLTYLQMEITKRYARGQDVSDARKAFAEIKLRKDNWVAVRDRERKYLWNVDTLIRVVEALTDCRVVDGVPSVGPAFSVMASELGYNAQQARVKECPESIYSELRGYSQINRSLAYVFAPSWVGLAPETRTSIIMNVTRRINPLVRGKHLKDKDGTPWYILEKGADVEQALRGKFVGINLPKIDHGIAADVIQALVVQRIYTGVKKRAPFGNKWHKEFPDQRPMMDICDECQLVVGEKELDMAPIARQLGLMMVMFTQSYENLWVQFDDQYKAMKFANTFQNIVALGASDLTYEYLTKRFGLVRKLEQPSYQAGLNYQMAARDWKNRPLNDLNHPNRAVMRRFELLGAGKVEATAQDKESVGWKGHQTKRKGEHSVQQVSTVDRKVGTKFGEFPLFGASSFNEELKQRGVAVVYLNRAGGPRADTASMNFVSDEVLDLIEENPDKWLARIAIGTQMGETINHTVSKY
ncbi:hypothetical protein [Novilysobacter arseniciresistens]|uniref:hypothetical protein n=1 Tax=Novilysobacter arseniciresistens TaxID=1385522 RepID=UPI000564B27B|nr:hypothetical protein [Lysobacter arseniciresistens]